MNEQYKVQVQNLVDDLKAVFTHAGLGSRRVQAPYSIFLVQILK